MSTMYKIRTEWEEIYYLLRANIADDTKVSDIMSKINQYANGAYECWNNDPKRE